MSDQNPKPMAFFHDASGKGALKALNRNIWLLSLPIFLNQGVSALVGFVTRVIISELGEKAFNSVNIGMMVFFLIITIVAAIGVGTTALVAQSWGTGDKRRAGEVMQQSLIYGAFLSLAIAILGIIFRKGLFTLLGIEAETAEMGARFLFWMFIGVPLLTPGFFFASALRGAGDTKTPMVAGVLTGFLTLILSYGLILGKLGMPNLGVVGAALATTLSFFCFTLILAGLIVTNKAVLKLPVNGWRPNHALALSIFKIGIPSATEWILIQLGLIVYIAVITAYGEAALAGFLAGLAVLSLAQTITFGFGAAATILVGQAIGAKDFTLAESVFRRSAVLSVDFLGGISVLLALVATPAVLSVVFNELSSESIIQARHFILLLAVAMPLMGVSFTIAGGLRGGGDTVWPLISSAIGMYGGRIVFALGVYHLFHPPVLIIWCSMFPDLILRIAILLVRLKSGKWKSIEV